MASTPWPAGGEEGSSTVLRGRWKPGFGMAVQLASLVALCGDAPWGSPLQLNLHYPLGCELGIFAGVKCFLQSLSMFVWVAASAVAIDPQIGAALKPGRFILIMYGEKQERSPTPVIVQVRSGGVADSLTIETEGGSQVASPMLPEGNALGFSITMPEPGIPAGPGVDGPGAHVMHFLGPVSVSHAGCLEGVFSDFRPYSTSHVLPPLIATGTFLLFPLGSK